MRSILFQSGSFLFVHLWFPMWCLCCPYLFLIFPSFGALGGLCFMFVAFSEYVIGQNWSRKFDTFVFSFVAVHCSQWSFLLKSIDNISSSLPKFLTSGFNHVF